MPLTPNPWRTGIVVNATTAGNQSDPSITQLANGNIVVSWTTDDPGGLGAPAGTEVFAQIFDPLGNKIGGEIRLNQNSVDDDEGDPDLAAMPDGGFLVTYWDRDFPNNSFAGNLRLERYDASGNKLPGNFIVVQDSGQPSAPEYYEPKVAVSSATSALIAYAKYDGSSTGIFGKIFNPTTNTFSAEFQLIISADSDFNPSVTVLTNGNYVIACRNDEGQIGEERLIYRIISPTGTSVQGSTEVLGTGDGDNFEDGSQVVAALAGGGFVIAWGRNDTSFGGFSGSSDEEILGRVFNAAGVQTGSFTVTGYSAEGSYNAPNIAALADGSFVVSYFNNDTNRTTIEHFSATGAQLGGVVSFPGRLAASIGLDDGRFAIVGTNGEIELNIFDTRDEPNASGVYTPAQRIIGTVDDDFIFPIDGTNIVNGWNGNDTIVGFGGPRSYFGDAGNDTFSVLAGINGSLYDGGSGTNTIDWSASGINTDGAKFWLPYSRVFFGGLEESMVGFGLQAGATFTTGTTFVAGSNAVAGTAAGTMLYNTTTGILSYDSDGSGAGAAVALAQIAAAPTVLASDFIVV